MPHIIYKRISFMEIDNFMQNKKKIIPLSLP